MSYSNYSDLLRSQGVIGASDQLKIQQQIITRVLDRIEQMPDFNEKSLYDQGAKEMKAAVIKEIKRMVDGR